MEFRDLKKQYEILKNTIDESIQSVIDSSKFINGPQIRQLEIKLAEYAGVKHCITCANGTDALSMMLASWGVTKGDAVFVPDFTFFATAEAVSSEGAVPVFVDVDDRTFNMDPIKLEQAIKEVLKEGILIPKAIIPVNLFGLPAPYDEINNIAEKHNLKVLEDSAQGFGGSIGDKKACSFGDAATTSFFPAKPLGCYGDGGAIFTDNDETDSYIRSIQAHGKGSYKYENIQIGRNSRLDTIQAAILLAKLQIFKDQELGKVKEIADTYAKLLDGYVITPHVPDSYQSSWAQYTIQLKNKKERDCLQQFLNSNKVPTMIYYPTPLHLQKAFEGNPLYQKCPVSEKLSNTVLSLPMHPYLDTESICFIANLIRNYLKSS